MKESYNPFKMWGSYIGVIIPLILFFTLVGAANNGTQFTFENPPIQLYYIYAPFYILSGFNSNPTLFFIGLNSFLPEGLVIIFAVLIAVGFHFMLGWGIHSLIRKMVK